MDVCHLSDEEEGNMQPPPKYTMSQKWIMDHQNKRLLADRSWGLKQQKVDQAIGARFNELKVTFLSFHSSHFFFEQFATLIFYYRLIFFSVQLYAFCFLFVVVPVFFSCD